MKWKILEINGVGNKVSNVRYQASNEGVETEGYWYFYEPKSLEGATEETVIEWVRQATMKDGKNTVESRLKEQADALKIQSIHLPWKAKTFTVTV